MDVEEINFEKASTEEMLSYLDKVIAEYGRSIKLPWHLDAPDIEDAKYTASERDEIYFAIQELKSRHVSYDYSHLRSLDKEWQGWILKCIKDGEVDKPFYPKEDEPENQWWRHIETLDKLTPSALEEI